MSIKYKMQKQILNLNRLAKILIIFLLLFFCTSNEVVSAQNSDNSLTNNQSINAGFVSGLWYSKFPFFQNDMIRIYVGFQNQSGHDISGTIVFYSNESKIGERIFSAIDGRMIESWIDWRAEIGEQKIKVELKNVVKNLPGGKTEPAQISSTIIESEKMQIDIDTDGDGIGDKNDPDDDNDGIPDEEELRRGTNPKVPDNQQKKLVDDKNKNEPITGAEIIDKATNVAENTIKGINSQADTWSGKVLARIEKIETQISAYKTEVEQVQDIVVSGTANLTAEEKIEKEDIIKKIEQKISLKQAELILMKIVHVVLVYKILFYIIAFFAIYFILRAIWIKLFG